MPREKELTKTVDPRGGASRLPSLAGSDDMDLDLESQHMGGRDGAAQVIWLQ